MKYIFEKEPSIGREKQVSVSAVFAVLWKALSLKHLSSFLFSPAPLAPPPQGAKQTVSALPLAPLSLERERGVGGIGLKKKGFSVVSSLVGFAILGLSTIGLATYIGSFEQTKASYRKQSTVYYKQRAVAVNIKKILTETKIEVASGGTGQVLRTAANQLRNEGLCKVLEEAVKEDNSNKSAYESIKNQKKLVEGQVLGSEVKAQLESEVLTDDRWKYFMEMGGLWEISLIGCAVSDNHGFRDAFTINKYNKCLKWLGDEENEIYARVSLEPVVAPKMKELGVGSGDKYFVSHLAFKTDVTLAVRIFAQSEEEEDSWSLARQKDIVWMIEAAECDVCDNSTPNKNCKIVNLLNTGFSHALRTENIVYLSREDSSLKCSDLSLSVSKNVIQKKGELAGNTIIQSKTDSNKAISCTQHLFRCKDDSERFAPKYLDPMIQASLNLKLDSLSDSNIDYIKLKITNGAAPTPTEFTNHPALMTSTDQSSFVIQDSAGHKEYHKDFKTTSPPVKTYNNVWPLKSGGNEYKLRAANKEGTASICAKACESPDTFYPELKIAFNKRYSGGDKTCTEKTFTLDGKTVGGIKNPDAKIACTTCHAKSCHRFGLGTFGSKADQKDDPIDSSLPECTGGGGGINLAFKDSTEAGQTTEDCMTFKNGKLISKSCTDTAVAHTMCFINGKMKAVAKSSSITAPGSAAPASVTLGLREEACYKASLERFRLGNESTNGLLANMAIAYLVAPRGSPSAIKDTLEREGLSVEGTSPNQYYELYNSANQGFYIGAEHNQGRDGSASSTEAWINIERDFSGILTAGLPLIPDVVLSPPTGLVNKIGWAYFFREPFQSASYSDFAALTKTDMPTGKQTKAFFENQFLTRSRPARPFFIKMKTLKPDFNGKFTAGTPGTPGSPGGTPAAAATTSADKRLLLTHHLHYKGLRVVNKLQAASNPYPFVCIDADGKVKVTSSKNKDFNEGYQACEGIAGGAFGFIPPTTSKQWTDAMLALAPNAPRYPFPNPFHFEDGIPFDNNVHDPSKNHYLNAADLKFNFADLGKTGEKKKDFNYSMRLDPFFIINAAVMRSAASGEANSALAPVRSAWIGLVPRTSSSLPADGSGDRLSQNWKLDLNELVNDVCDGTGLCPDSFYRTTKPHNDIRNAMVLFRAAPNDSSDWPLDDGYMGIMSAGGGDIRRHSFMFTLTDTAAQKLYDSLGRMCRFKKTELSMKWHLMTILRADSSQKTTAAYIPSSCTASSPALPDSRSASDLAEITEDDIAGTSGTGPALRTSVRGAAELWKYHKKGRYALFNKDRFCRSWNREKERRAKSRCLINKYKAGTLTVGGVTYSYANTKTCRENLVNNTHCSASAVTNSTNGYRKKLSDEKARADQDAINKKAAWQSCTSNCTSLANSCAQAAAYKAACDRLTTQPTAAACKNALLPGSPLGQAKGTKGCIEYKYKTTTATATATACGLTKTDDCFVKFTSVRFNDQTNKQCWSLDHLNPRVETQSVNGKTGIVGIAGANQHISSSKVNQYWTQDSNCASCNTTGLKELNKDECSPPPSFGISSPGTTSLLNDLPSDADSYCGSASFANDTTCNNIHVGPPTATPTPTPPTPPPPNPPNPPSNPPQGTPQPTTKTPPQDDEEEDTPPPSDPGPSDSGCQSRLRSCQARNRNVQRCITRASSCRTRNIAVRACQRNHQTCLRNRQSCLSANAAVQRCRGNCITPAPPSMTPRCDQACRRRCGSMPYGSTWGLHRWIRCVRACNCGVFSQNSDSDDLIPRLANLDERFENYGLTDDVHEGPSFAPAIYFPNEEPVEITPVSHHLCSTCGSTRTCAACTRRCGSTRTCTTNCGTVRNCGSC